jgi:heptosyltransferase III
MQRLLVIRGGAVGDLIVTLPVLGALRQAFPQVGLDVLGHASRAILARHPSYADGVRDLDAEGWHRLFRLEAVAPKPLDVYLRTFDLVLSYLPASDPGFDENLRRYCPGTVITWPPHPSDGVHATNHLLQAASHLLPGIAVDLCPQVHLEPQAQVEMAELWHSTGLPEHGVIALHPGSGGHHKLWPLDGWTQVMTWVEQQGLTGIIICGPAEQERDLRPLREVNSAAWRWMPALTLPQLAALLARCRVVLGHDSGVTHLAAAVGTTVLALFGPTDPLSWGPRSPHACVVQPSPSQALTLENLAPQVVTETLDALLRQTFEFDTSQTPCTIVRP